MIRNNKIWIQHYHTPCGDLLLGSFEEKLCLCNWMTGNRRLRIDHRLQSFLHAEYCEGTSDILEEARNQLDAYFRRERRQFELSLLCIGTDFQKSVWQKLLEIPYGTTISYAELSRWLGQPKAVRAVANANGANPISIFIPCHRVIGSNHSLIGYGGGLPAKQMLLKVESEEC